MMPRHLQALLRQGTEEHYEDPHLYDHEYRTRRADVNFYRRLAKARGEPLRVLELGAGTGRVTVPLAKDGHHVLGVDVAQSMLDRARERVSHLSRAVIPRIRLVHGDMRALSAGERFPLVICPFNALQHMYTREDLAQTLAVVAEHLEPGGVFAFDVLNPDIEWLGLDPERRWARTRFKHPVTKETLIYSTNQTYDPVHQLAHIRIYYDPPPDRTGPSRVVHLTHRQFFPAELEALLWASRFEIVTRHGGFDGEALAGDSESQVIVCRPRTCNRPSVLPAPG